MAPVMRVAPLTGDHPGLPAPCGSCVFWQEPRRAIDTQEKERWSERMRSSSGAWGLVLWSGETFQGLIQYGPAKAFRRARVLPAGPPSADAALITCMWIDDDDPVGIAERLVLEALADLKAKGATRVETFAAAVDRERPSASRPSHHTLQDPALLERMGFLPVRDSGAVTLMRLELGGLQSVASRVLQGAERMRGLLPTRTPAPQTSR